MKNYTAEQLELGYQIVRAQSDRNDAYRAINRLNISQDQHSIARQRIIDALDAEDEYTDQLHATGELSSFDLQQITTAGRDRMRAEGLTYIKMPTAI